MPALCHAHQAVHESRCPGRRDANAGSRRPVINKKACAPTFDIVCQLCLDMTGLTTSCKHSLSSSNRCQFCRPSLVCDSSSPYHPNWLFLPQHLFFHTFVTHVLLLAVMAYKFFLQRHAKPSILCGRHPFAIQGTALAILTTMMQCQGWADGIFAYT